MDDGVVQGGQARAWGLRTSDNTRAPAKRYNDGGGREGCGCRVRGSMGEMGKRVARKGDLSRPRVSESNVAEAECPQNSSQFASGLREFEQADASVDKYGSMFDGKLLPDSSVWTYVSVLRGGVGDASKLLLIG